MAGFEEESFQSGASNPAEDRGALFMTSVLISLCQAPCSSMTSFAAVVQVIFLFL